MKKSFPFIIVNAILLMACTPKEASQVESVFDEAKTKEVLDRHFDAFKNNELETTMADYTDESVLVTPDRTYRGLVEIRENFELAFGLFPKDSTTFQLNKSEVVKDVGYILWQAKTPKFNLTYAT